VKFTILIMKLYRIYVSQYIFNSYHAEMKNNNWNWRKDSHIWWNIEVHGYQSWTVFRKCFGFK